MKNVKIVDTPASKRNQTINPTPRQVKEDLAKALAKQWRCPDCGQGSGFDHRGCISRP
jgi:hypothetical protein